MLLPAFNRGTSKTSPVPAASNRKRSGPVSPVSLVPALVNRAVLVVAVDVATHSTSSCPFAMPKCGI